MYVTISRYHKCQFFKINVPVGRSLLTEGLQNCRMFFQHIHVIQSIWNSIGNLRPLLNDGYSKRTFIKKGLFSKPLLNIPLPQGMAAPGGRRWRRRQGYVFHICWIKDTPVAAASCGALRARGYIFKTLWKQTLVCQHTWQKHIHIFQITLFMFSSNHHL